LINPFEKIVAPDPGDPEELGGQYECEVCFKITDKAYYYEDAKLVVWYCPDKHRNHVEGVEFD